MLKSEGHLDVKCNPNVHRNPKIQILHLVGLENTSDNVCAITSMLEPSNLNFHRSAGKLYPTLV